MPHFQQFTDHSNKINKETFDLNKHLQNFHSKEAEYTVFSNANGTSPGCIMLGIKISLSKF